MSKKIEQYSQQLFERVNISHIATNNIHSEEIKSAIDDLVKIKVLLK